MEIPIHHDKVRLLLEKFLLHDIGNETASNEAGHCFYNFGTKIKVVVTSSKLEMYLGFVGWDLVQDSVVDYLQNLIGEGSESKVLVGREFRDTIDKEEVILSVFYSTKKATRLNMEKIFVVNYQKCP